MRPDTRGLISTRSADTSPCIVNGAARVANQSDTERAPNAMNAARILTNRTGSISNAVSCGEINPGRCAGTLCDVGVDAGQVRIDLVDHLLCPCQDVRTHLRGVRQYPEAPR